jgi:homoserine dehydrogenase
MIGCGTVGGGVALLLREQADLLAQRLGRPIRLSKVLLRNSNASRPGVDAALPPRIVTTDAEEFFATKNISVIIEVAGGRGLVSQYVRRAIEAGKHVVTANKSLLAAEGPQLFALARKHHVSIGFEASCGGAIPCITALQFGLMANDIKAMYAILNGTCNYILTQMTRAGKAYDVALKEAQQQGFAEADPTLDVSGQDAAQKLAILASLAFGARVLGDDVPATGIDALELEDIHYAAELGYDVKLLAIAERDTPTAPLSVGVRPCFVRDDALLAQVSGAFNAISVYGHAAGHTMYYGAGAGRMPTASAVVSDLLNIASGWYPAAFANMRLTSDLHEPARLMDAADLVSRFYMRIHALDVPGVMAKVTGLLGEAGISLSAVMQHEAAVGQFVPVVILTHDARQGDLLRAVNQIASLDVIRGQPVVIRIVDVANH